MRVRVSNNNMTIRTSIRDTSSLDVDGVVPWGPPYLYQVSHLGLLSKSK